MSLEGLIPSIPNYKELKEQFKQRLDAIIYKGLTVENIETFADEALNELVYLNKDILEKYRENLPFGPQLNEQRQEDDAYGQLELPNIQEILVKIIEARSRIEKIKEQLIKNRQFSDKIITPPQEEFEITPGNGEGLKQLELFPRLLTLVYILETDFEINQNNIQITEGKVTDQMMRKEPYFRVEIPELNRAVYICNEEGNASYVFDTERLKSLRIPLNDLDIDDKGDKNSLIAMHPGTGARIIQTKKWRRNISKLLSEKIPEQKFATQDTIEKFEKEGGENCSEFIGNEFVSSKDKWLPFDKFQEEVRAIYVESQNVERWYRQERQNHRHWPGNPYDAYKNKGWVGFPELVGKENYLKKERPAFDRFKEEVMAVYEGQSDVNEWYKTERNKHPHWPRNPSQFYEGKGWVGWPELVDVENRLKKWLPFSQFKDEVMRVYSGQSNVQDWYTEEQKKHRGWPTNPQSIYMKKEWSGFSELVGKENPLKKNFLSFDQFLIEVRNLYSGQTNVQKWYHKEYKKHPSWPSNPHRTYKNKGWTSYAKLVAE
jgi:hypothetical protein